MLCVDKTYFVLIILSLPVAPAPTKALNPWMPQFHHLQPEDAQHFKFFNADPSITKSRNTPPEISNCVVYMVCNTGDSKNMF
uniref:Secreted protein n=1 Tax=Steinernema glaseri TaxID=37863 RepID=A0A1I8A781_9BILA